MLTDLSLERFKNLTRFICNYKFGYFGDLKIRISCEGILMKMTAVLVELGVAFR